jgi:gas vesicle protein
MSYAGPASRNRGSTQSRGPSLQGSGQPSAPRRDVPRGDDAHEDEATHETDWQQIAIFGAGLALGLALGAGTALLTAPQSGEETRAVLKSRVKRLKRTARRTSRDAWTELGDELRGAAQSLRRRRAIRAEKRVAERDLRREARELAAD